MGIQDYLKDCFAYIACNVLSLLDDKRLFLLFGIVAIGLCVPLFIAIPTGADYLYGHSSIRNQRDFLAAQIVDGIYSSAPRELQSEVNGEMDALNRAIENEHKPSEYYAAIADRNQFMLEEYQKGYISGAESAVSLEAAERLPRLISTCSAPETYATTSEMPGLYLVAYYSGAIPDAIWLCIPLAVSFLALSGFSKGFADQSPLSLLQKYFCKVCVVEIVSLSILIAAIAPSFMLASMLNGLGTPDYPVVFVQFGALTERTILLQCLIFFVFSTALYFIVSCLAIFTFSLSARRAISVVVAGLASGMGLFPGYSSRDAPWSAYLPYLLPSYSLASSTSGGASYANGMDIALCPQGSWSTLLLTVLLNTSLFVLGILVASLLGFRKRWAWNRGTYGTQGKSNHLVVSLSEVRVSGFPLIGKTNLDISSGEIAGLVAPNGYGKTTLLNVIYGQPKSTIRVYGSQSINGERCIDNRSMRSSFFLVPNDNSLLFEHNTVDFHLKWSARLWKSPHDMGEVLSLLDLENVRRKRVSELSDGNKQLLNIALALVSGCNVLLFDEPMNALDLGHVGLVSHAIGHEASRGAQIVISSHLIDNLETLCDEVILLTKEGSHISVKPKEGNSQWIRNVYEAVFGTTTKSKGD